MPLCATRDVGAGGRCRRRCRLPSAQLITHTQTPAGTPPHTPPRRRRRRCRRIGAFYMRLVGRPADVYQYLEPLYNDYRRLRLRSMEGRCQPVHVDEVRVRACRG